MKLGITFLVIGIIMFLKELGYLSMFDWSYFWPTLFVLLGLFMILKKR